MKKMYTQEEVDELLREQRRLSEQYIAGLTDMVRLRPNQLGAVRTELGRALNFVLLKMREEVEELLRSNKE